MTLLFATVCFAQFPAPYCGPLTFTTNVEPITLVNFADLNNVSNASAVGATAHEDYTALTANVAAGSSYTITLKGNTDGPFTNRFIVFIDWNQDGDFADAGESYPIAQTIFSSTGEDDIMTTGPIEVPATALGGTTRMRVKKIFSNVNYADPCLGTAYGQVEDYSVIVTIPSCLAPSAGMAMVTSSTTATLTWISANPQFEVLVQLQGAGMPAMADGTGVNVVGTSYSATGLMAGTLYEFYVRSECTSATDFSTWSGPYLFDTTQAPSCASNPSPADMAVDVPVGDITFSWDAPATGDPATSYDLLAGDDPMNLQLVSTFDTNSADLVINAYGVTIYWQVVPSNSGGQATGCPVWSFTVQDSPGFCLNAPNGQWPGATYVPAECDGVTENVITTVGYAGEYSVVTVTNGQTYTFTSGDGDFITIGDEAGSTAYAFGTSPVTWVSTVDGDIRFYTHVDDQCGDNTDARVRSIVCGVSSSDTPDYAGLQFPATLNLSQGMSGDVYGQVYEAGLTDVVPNIIGQAPGITASVGISPEGQNTDPSTWTTFVPAAWNPAFVGNNDEYFASIGANLPPGTYYYATRFRLNNGAYVYGGINSSGEGNFWDGSTYLSGVLTIAPPPAPANDLCEGAQALTAGNTFAANAVMGTVLGATTDAPVPSCQTLSSQDVWYSLVVPTLGNIIIETQMVAGSLFTDSIITAFSGTCGNLTEIGCDDDGGAGLYSMLSLTGLTPGDTIYIVVSKFGTNATAQGSFMVSAYDPLLATTSFDSNGFTYYPNPVKNVLNLSYTKTIDSVSIYNLLGQEVMNRTINANQSSIDMSAFSNGAYLVKVTSGNQVKTLKVIKQ